MITIKKKVLKVGKNCKLLLLFILYPLAYAQDHQHLHVAPSKPNSCITKGIECANAATPFITNDVQLWLVSWTRPWHYTDNTKWQGCGPWPSSCHMAGCRP